MVFSLHVTTTKCNTLQALFRSPILDTSLPRLCALKASVINCQLIPSINILDRDNTPSALQLTSRSTVNKFAIDAYMYMSWLTFGPILKDYQTSVNQVINLSWLTFERLSTDC